MRPDAVPVVQRQRTSLSYRPEIDGLRALAIIPVIFFHAGLDWFGGGYIGVDVFFVISGYLITSIILDERKQTGAFSFTNFYVRRARRILPALFFVLSVVSIFAWLWMMPVQLKSASKAVLAVILFSSNILFARGSAYFDAGAELNPLLHTWSLGVEEQYYLLFPLLLLWLWRFNLNRMKVVLATLAVISLCLCEWAWRTYPFMNFYSLPTRTWELLMGSLVAFHLYFKPEPRSFDPSVSNPVAIVGLLMIAVPVFIFDKATPFPSLYTLIPTCGVALILIYAQAGTFAARLLSVKWVVGVGLISYSAYLWHQPLFAFARIGWGNRLPFYVYLFLILLTGGLAYLSWRYIEQPFRNSKLIPRSTALAFIGVLGVLLAVMGWVGDHKNGFPQRLGAFNIAANAYGGEGLNFGVEKFGVAGLRPSFVIYGDSHALQYIGSLDTLAKKQNFAFVAITHPACLALPNLTNINPSLSHATCMDELKKLEEQIAGTDLPVVVIYRWLKFLADAHGTEIGRVGESERIDHELTAALERLHREIGKDRKLVIIGNVPATNLIEIGGYISCNLRRLSECPAQFEENKGELYSLRTQMKQYAASQHNVLFLDPYDALCDGENCMVAKGKKSLYSDHAHLSRFGADIVIEKFKPDILSIAGSVIK